MTDNGYKKDQGISNTIISLSFVFELFNVIASAVMAKGGNLQDLRRILKESALQRQIADLVVPVSSLKERTLYKNEYRVHVAYDKPKKHDDESSEHGVTSSTYNHYKWKLHPLCIKIDQSPGDRFMLVKRFNAKTKSKTMITEMSELGYRPATHFEAYVFAKTNPKRFRGKTLVALGSSAMFDRKNLGASMLWSDVIGHKRLTLSWFNDIGRCSGCLFLFVRKDPPT